MPLAISSASLDLPGHIFTMTWGNAVSLWISFGASERRFIARWGCFVPKAGGDAGGPKGPDYSGDKYACESRAGGEQAERGRPEPKRYVEERGVGAHRKAPALGRDLADSFDAEARIDERIAKAGQPGAEETDRKIGCEPDQRETCRLDEDAEEGDLGGCEAVREVAEQKARENEDQREDTEGGPRGPPARDEQQGAEGDDGPEPDAAQSGAGARDPYRAHHFHESGLRAADGPNGLERKDEENGRERQDDCGGRNGGKAVVRI